MAVKDNGNNGDRFTKVMLAVITAGIIAGIGVLWNITNRVAALETLMRLTEGKFAELTKQLRDNDKITARSELRLDNLEKGKR